MSTFIKYAKEHLIGFLFSAMFGVITTASLFYFTASPTSSSEIKNKLKDIVISSESNKSNRIKEINFESIINQSLDFSSKESIFAIGDYKMPSSNDYVRFIAIFEAKKENLIDKLVGRAGFYNLSSLSKIEIENLDREFVVDTDNIKFEDIDLDGNKEIIFNVNNFYADGSSTGRIILRKDTNEKWHFISLPSLKKIFSDRVNDINPHPQMLMAFSPMRWFGKTSSVKKNTQFLKKEYKKYDILEEDFGMTHNGEDIVFLCVRGNIIIKDFTHSYKKYYQIGIAADVVDDNAVLDNHHIMITFLNIENNKLIPDLLWNWGYPMLSTDVENFADDINLDDFHKAGINAHLSGDTFFTYTDFEKH